MTEHNQQPAEGGGFDPADAIEAIVDAVRDSIRWPYSSDILSTIYNAVADNTWTVLPPKSHLEVLRDEKWVKGVDVVAMRVNAHGKTEVITCRGDTFPVGEAFGSESNLVLGR